MTPWTQCYRCLCLFVASTPGDIFPNRFVRLSLSPGFLSQYLRHPRVWNGDVLGKCQPIARDYRPTGHFVLLRTTTARFFSSLVFRVFHQWYPAVGRRRPIISLSVFMRNAECFRKWSEHRTQNIRASFFFLRVFSTVCRYRGYCDCNAVLIIWAVTPPLSLHQNKQ